MIAVSMGTQQTREFAVRRVPLRQPIEWLDRGWDDLKQIGAPGLAHGALIAILGGVLLMLGSTHLYLTAAAVTGYLLVGPIMTTGACELARRLAAREPLGFDESLQALTRNPVPSLAVVLWGGATSASSAQILGYVLCGGVLAAVVFALSVVAVPLIIDRHASASEAMRASLRAVLANLPVMLVWAFLIVGLTAIAFVTLLVGMVIVAPLLGYATWHAYRDLIS